MSLIGSFSMGCTNIAGEGWWEFYSHPGVMFFDLVPSPPKMGEYFMAPTFVGQLFFVEPQLEIKNSLYPRSDNCKRYPIKMFAAAEALYPLRINIFASQPASITMMLRRRMVNVSQGKHLITVQAKYS